MTLPFPLESLPIFLDMEPGGTVVVCRTTVEGDRAIGLPLARDRAVLRMLRTLARQTVIRDGYSSFSVRTIAYAMGRVPTQAFVQDLFASLERLARTRVQVEWTKRDEGGKIWGATRHILSYEHGGEDPFSYVHLWFPKL